MTHRVRGGPRRRAAAHLHQPQPGEAMSDDLREEFDRAADDVKQLPARPDNDTLLKLYALYKQGSEGDVRGQKPGFFDFVGTAKYEAWARLQGMRTAEARQKYIALVRALEAHGQRA